jgi:MFS transporter, DHA1 family, tetracycline resistance protein
MDARLSETAPETVSDDAPRAAIPTLLGVMFVNMVGFGVVVPLLPFYAKSFNAPAWQIALIFSAYAAGAFFGEPFWGRMSDRLGRKPILISTVCGNCLCYFALAFAPNIWVAFVVRFLGGMASGNGSVIQGYIADVTPPEGRAARMSMLGAAYNLGFIVGPGLGGMLANPAAGHAGFRLPLIIAAALAALCAIGIAFFVKESRARHHHIFDSQPSRWAVTGRALTHPVIVRLMAVMFLAGSAFMGIEFAFPLWSAARFGWTTWDVGRAFMVTGVVAASCQLLITARASRKFGEANVLAAGMALTTAAIALQPFAHRAGIVVLLALSAFGQSIAGPNISALISRYAEPQNQGQYLGLNNAAGALARLTGPFVAGLAFADIGVDAPFYLAGLLVAPAILLALQARR